MSTKHLAPMSLLLTNVLAAGSLYPAYTCMSVEASSFAAYAGKSSSRSVLAPKGARSGEATHANGHAGSVSNPNPLSWNLMNNLAEAQGTPMAVRVGGNSGDRHVFDPTLTTPTAGSCPNADPGAYQCIGPKYFESFGALGNGTKYSYQWNLATYNSSGFDTLAATVPLACNALRGQLLLWEMGNEPDLYSPARRPSTYSVTDYATEWLNATSRFEALLQEACPDLAGDVQYIAPSVSSPGAKFKIQDILKAEGGATSKIKQICSHNYMAGATSPGTSLQGTLMSHAAVQRSVAGHVNYAASAADPNADYVLGEQNSLYGGGANGLSDTVGAALWTTDFFLTAASTKVIKRVCLHQSASAAYAAWNPVVNAGTKAPYYGWLAAARFLRNSDTLDVEQIPLTNDTNLDSGYAASVDGELVRLAALNLRQFNSSTPQQSRPSQTYTFQVDARSSWTVMRLTAAGATDLTGLTFNGFAYELSTLGVATPAYGRESNVVVVADSTGKLAIKVFDTEAVVLEKL